MYLILASVVPFLLAHSAFAWTQVRDLRLPGELRIANEGLSHDDEYWYISNAHVLFKTTVSPIEIVLQNYHAIPEELGKRRYDHIGDIDVFEGKKLFSTCYDHNSSQRNIVC